jgi:hypothetical protein
MENGSQMKNAVDGAELDDVTTTTASEQSPKADVPLNA